MRRQVAHLFAAALCCWHLGNCAAETAACRRAGLVGSRTELVAGGRVCTTLQGDLEIGGTTDIVDLEVLSNLTHIVNGGLYFYNNAALTNVRGVSTAQVATGANLAYAFLPTTDCLLLTDSRRVLTTR